MSEDIHRLAEEGALIAYFGYGSLVNPNTHRTNIVHYERAQLRGFARSWQARPDASDMPIALLSASSSQPTSVLDGLLVFDYSENLTSLDEREAGYDRLQLTSDQLSLAGDGKLPNCPLYVYSARVPFAPNQPHSILQSYLDAVLQGYLHQYGEDGARNFIERTARFETPLLEDRDAPHYPRAVKLSADEAAFIDALTGFMTRV